MIPRQSTTAQRKDDLIAIGLWGVTTGRGWLVRAVEAAFAQEGLLHV
jgi:hypothetical protein